MPGAAEQDQAQLALVAERERLADQREQQLDELAQQLGARSVIQLQRAHAAIERSSPCWSAAGPSRPQRGGA